MVAGSSPASDFQSGKLSIGWDPRGWLRVRIPPLTSNRGNSRSDGIHSGSYILSDFRRRKLSIGWKPFALPLSRTSSGTSESMPRAQLTTGVNMGVKRKILRLRAAYAPFSAGGGCSVLPYATSVRFPYDFRTTYVRLTYDLRYDLRTTHVRFYVRWFRRSSVVGPWVIRTPPSHWQFFCPPGG